jgi:hypothetical protein
MTREVNVQVAEEFLNCTAFLGQGIGDGFVAAGTCFFVQITEDELTFPYAVSARHVVRPYQCDRTQTPNPDSIAMRINVKEQPTTRLFATNRADWVPHPDRFIDICVYPFNFMAAEAPDIGGGTLEINTLMVDIEPFPPRHSVLLTDELRRHWRFSLGDEVFIPSLFVGRLGDRRNIPVVRVATIAAMDREPVAYGSPRRPAYLVETKSLGGTSGAPVFFHTKASSRTEGVLQRDQQTGDFVTPYLLLGMLIGAHGGQYEDDFVTDNPVVLKDVEFNAGISIVLPISQVMEVIHCDRLREARQAKIAERRKLSGYRPTDAKIHGG